MELHHPQVPEKFTLKNIWKNNNRAFIFTSDHNILYHKGLIEFVIKIILSPVFDNLIIDELDWVSGHQFYRVFGFQRAPDVK